MPKITQSWWALELGFRPKPVIQTSRAQASSPNYSSPSSYCLGGPDELLWKKNPTTPWDGAHTDLLLLLFSSIILGVMSSNQMKLLEAETLLRGPAKC